MGLILGIPLALAIVGVVCFFGWLFTEDTEYDTEVWLWKRDDSNEDGRWN